MKESLRQERAYRLLYRLGLCEAKKCFATTADAVCICAANPARLEFVTKDLYLDLAKRHGTSWHVVERHLRTPARLPGKRHRTCCRCWRATHCSGGLRRRSLSLSYPGKLPIVPGGPAAPIWAARPPRSVSNDRFQRRQHCHINQNRNWLRI